jgi:hypothetical protein
MKQRAAGGGWKTLDRNRLKSIAVEWRGKVARRQLKQTARNQTMSIFGLIGAGIGGFVRASEYENAGNAAQRDPYGELYSMARAQQQTNPGVISGIYGQMPYVNQQYNSTLGSNAAAQYGIYSSLGPSVAAYNTQANRLMQQGAMNTVDMYGSRVLGQQQALNPELYGALGSMSSAAAGSNVGASPYAGALEGTLGGQALADLQLGGKLSAADTRQAQQGARAAYAARGLYDSNGAIGAEILNTDALSRQRLAERQQAAAGAATALRQGAGSDSALQSDYINRLGSAASAWGANRFDPYAGVLGTSSGDQLNSAGIVAGAAGTTTDSVNQLYGLYSPYASYADSVGKQNSTATLVSRMADGKEYGNIFSNMGAFAAGAWG